MIGRRIGSWVLERELGRGGMGSVFEARHVSLGTRAAVKVLLPGLESEESFRQRFHREANLQAQLRHSNVVRVLDYLEDQGQWFLVVEYLNRGSLGDLLAGGEKVSRQQALAWTRQALAGLGHAHQKGVVHRDIKPANLLLGEDGEIVVMDFGIARVDGAPGLTTTGVAIGTPQYMSPEQILTPERIDRRTDIYSLGVVLYELLAGRKPFDSGSQFAVLQAHVSEPPPPLRAIDPGISPELEAVVMRCLAKRPEDRYADCESLIRDLDRVAAAPAQAFVAPAPVAMGATVRPSVFFDPAVVPTPGGPSPGEVRDRRRRIFQRWLAAGVVATLVIATLLASELAKVRSTSRPAEEVAKRPIPVPPPPQPQPPIGKEPQAGHEEPPVHTDPNHRISEVIRPLESSSGAEEPLSARPVSSSSPQPPPIQPTPTPPTPVLPPPYPALPERPRVAVIGMGDDPLLAGALEQEMEERLNRYDVADEQGDPDVGELLEGKAADVSPKALGAQLLKSGFQILVLLRVEQAAERTKTIAGISGSLKASRMRLNAYLLPANRSLGRGWTELVEYTELSAAPKARHAFVGPTADLRKAIDDEWALLRSGAAPSH